MKTVIEKRSLSLDSYFFPGDAFLSRETMSKEASLASDTQSFVQEKIEPDKNSLIIIVNGMGASEFWGPNVNGDWFGEEALTGRQTESEAMKNPGDDCGKRLKRFKTFKNGHFFEHHRNDDPEKSIGDLIDAFFNPRMHRVEIIAKVTDESGKNKIINRKKRGKPLPVSMGCFLPNERVVRYNREMSPIEDIESGDRIITHCSGESIVEEVHKRNYNGKIYYVSAASNEPIGATEKHPWYVLKKNKVKNKYGSDGKEYYRRKDPDEIDVDDGDWICSSHLREGDYLVKPIDQTVRTPDYVSSPLARLLGYYCAEGHVELNKKGEPCGIELTVHEDDAIHSEIEDIINDIDTDYELAFRKRENTPAEAIALYDPQIARLCWQHCGRYSREKKLSRSIQQWDYELQLEFLGAYFNGDGWQAENTGDKGCGMISTSSPSLANQIQHMLWRCGIHCGMNNNIHKAGKGFSHHKTKEYIIRIGKTQINKLAPYCKADRYGSDESYKGKRYLLRNAMLVPITSIETEQYEGPVYNLEVEHDDSSYLIDGFGVHNCRVPEDYCSVCGNAAPSTTDYCKHLNSMMGKVLDDGRKVYAINKQPRFFDLSRVTVPADKTAYALDYIEPDSTKEAASQVDFGQTQSGRKKVASKNSSMDKEVQPQEQSDHRYMTEDELEDVVGKNSIDTIAALMSAGASPKEAECQWLTIGEFNKEAALELCRDSTYYKTPDIDEPDKGKIKEAIKNASVNQNTLLNLENYIRDNSVYSQQKTAENTRVNPEPAPLPKIEKIDGMAERAAMKGTAGIAGGAIMGSLVDRLKNAIHKESPEMVSKLIRKFPSLKFVIMSIMGAGATLSEVGLTGPDAMMGRT